MIKKRNNSWNGYNTAATAPHYFCFHCLLMNRKQHCSKTGPISPFFFKVGAVAHWALFLAFLAHYNHVSPLISFCVRCIRYIALFYFKSQLLSNILKLITVFENNRKSLIQHCERSELRLHYEWTKVHKKCQK